MMRSEVECILKRAAGRMLLARVLESAAVAATAAGCVCVGIMLLWSLMGLTGQVRVAPWMFPVVLFPGGAAVGAVWGLLKGTTPRAAAVFLDQRFGLQERLSTAAELAEAGDDDSPARCVYAQAFAAARNLPADRVSFWSRTRKTPAALLLVMILCGVLLLLLPSGPAGGGAETERIIRRLDAMSLVRRAAVAEAFRQAAGEAKDQANQRNLAAIAKAIEVGDNRSLRELLEAMELSGLKPMEILPTRLQREPDIASHGEGPSTAGDRKRQLAGDNGGVSSPRDDSDTDRGGRIGVYNPDYARTVRSAEKHTPGGSTRRAAAMLDSDEPWRAVCARAGQAMETGRVPPAYRPIVRAFFRNGLLR